MDTRINSGSAGRKDRNPYLEAVLELGRNWALAIAICSAGLAANATETVNGPQHWEEAVFIGCIVLSFAWIVMAALRFDESLVREVRVGRPHLISILVLATLIPLGIGIVVGLAKFSENLGIVRICDSVPNNVPSKIHSYEECVRLRVQRDALRQRLESP